jgi:hypothetical protein
MEKNKIPNKILNSCINERNQMRKDNFNIVEKKIIVETDKYNNEDIDDDKNNN